MGNGHYSKQYEFRERSNSGGARTSGFTDFIEDPICTKLCQEYQDGKIPTKQELLKRLLENGKKISMPTLKNYLEEINQATSQIGKFGQEKGPVLTWMPSSTIFGKEKAIIIGSEGENNWRMFRRDKEKNDVEYFRCNCCGARAIIRNGELEKPCLIRHDFNCRGQPHAIFLAKDIDREARKNLREGWHEKPKSMWREGYEIAQKIDVSNDVSVMDPCSVSRNYPSWTNVRSSYNKCRQEWIGDCSDPYNLPEILKVTQFGHIKLKMGKETTENERWLLHSNKEMGIIIFATETQLNAANWCTILVCDATFDVAPKGFYQLYTIHGLFSRESSTEIGEWIVLAWALMEKRKTENYVQVLQILRAEWEKKGKLHIQRIHCDYEKAECNAVKAVFNENLLYGCLFHFVKAALLHMRKELPNIFKLYIDQKKIKGEFWKWVRRIIALPLLRKEIIVKIWNELKRWPFGLSLAQMNECHEFCRYMENEWFGKGNMFNFYKVGRVRGINAAESYHSALKKDPQTIIHAKPVNFIKWQQTLASEVDARILKLMENETKYKSRSKKYENVDQRIEQIVKDYEQWLAANIGNMEYNEFVYGTKYALSLVSYQLVEINEVGIPVKQAKKKLNRQKKDQEKCQEFDHDYADQVIKVEDLLNSPEKKKICKSDNTKNEIPSQSGRQLTDKNNWATIRIGRDPIIIWNFVWRTIKKSNGKLEMPYYDQSGPINIPDGRIEFFFQQCVEKGIKFILFFCEDDRHKKKVRDCANLYRGKGKLFDQPYAYITPEDVKVEADLLSIIENILDGFIEIESSDESEDEEKNNEDEKNEEKEEDDDDVEFLGVGDDRQIHELIFNPPDRNFVKDICNRWNYKMGNTWFYPPNINKKFQSTATPDSTSFEKGNWIRGDGNCGFRSISQILTGCQDNHVKIRQDIQRFLIEEKRQFESGREECGWWTAYYNAEQLDERIKNRWEPAKDASEDWKYASNFDFIAASLLFGLNFVQCSRKNARQRANDGCNYNWEIYNARRGEMGFRGIQDLNRPTCFIEFINGNHFEVVQDVIPENKKK